MIIQISLTVTMKATGNVIQPGVPARGDVTTPVRSSAGSVLKSALGEKLRLRAITCSCDPKANHKPQADFHQRVQLSVLPAVARCSWVCVSNVRKEKGGRNWSPHQLTAKNLLATLAQLCLMPGRSCRPWMCFQMCRACSTLISSAQTYG